jgi:type VI secretion system secreted protein VgrG
MPTLELTFESGESSLSVRRFAVHEALSTFWTASVWARSPDASIDLEALVGKSASFTLEHGYAHVTSGKRVFSGIVQRAEQGRPDVSDKGLSTYLVVIVPKLWLLTQRRNYRVYQHLSIPDIADKLLGEWEIKPEWRIDRGKYPPLEYKVQYDESDYDFLSRLLEEAGITLYFDDSGGSESKMVLGDELHKNEKRAGGPIPYQDNPTQAAEKEFITQVHFGQEVRHGAHTMRDHDFRNPAFNLLGEAPKAQGLEAQLEHYRYRPGAFLVEGGKGGDTPSADDRGVARHENEFAKGRAERALHADRAARRSVRFDGNMVDLRPGTVFSMDGHAHPDVDNQSLLVQSFSIEGAHGEEWRMSGHAVHADAPYYPPEKTPTPEVFGVQTATVVGPAGEEIHTDEFGRIRIQFPWDREGKNDETASCWIRINQSWGGQGYGGIVLPRIGQEVLIGFLEGHPDRPVMLGRVYNQTQPLPYKLPDNKTVSGWKSNSSPGGGGYNEIKFEDKAADEEINIQAEKNLRKRVLNDETIMVGNDRQKTVKVNEQCTTGNNRVEVTGRHRSETTQKNRMIHVKALRDKLVMMNETWVTQGNHKRHVDKDLDRVIKGKKREQVGADVHQLVKGSRREKIDGTQSLQVGEDQFEKVANNHALAVARQIHLMAGANLVGEAPDITFKGAGGFVRIHPGGITIKGTLVQINVGGSPGTGKGVKAEDPEGFEPAKIDPGGGGGEGEGEGAAS